MTDRIKCFFIESANKEKLWLRRYISGSSCNAPGNDGYHQAWNPLGVFSEQDTRKDVPHDDPRWPKACACGLVFSGSVEWQVFTSSVYRRTDTGEEFALRDAPPGAIWNAPWLTEFQHGPDGLCLICKLPNGHCWTIDGRASNCTLPEDTDHKCWVRHGIPPDLTVDKNGKTCGAGAGSIQGGDWHGFLRNGWLERC